MAQVQNLNVVGKQIGPLGMLYDAAHAQCSLYQVFITFTPKANSLAQDSV